MGQKEESNTNEFRVSVPFSQEMREAVLYNTAKSQTLAFFGKPGFLWDSLPWACGHPKGFHLLTVMGSC